MPADADRRAQCRHGTVSWKWHPRSPSNTVCACAYIYVHYHVIYWQKPPREATVESFSNRQLCQTLKTSRIHLHVRINDAT